MAAVLALLLHAYPTPPLAVSKADWFVHIVSEAGLTCAAGLLFTTTFTMAVPLQPTPLLTVTVYEVPDAGETVILCELAPLFQVYDVPAVTARVTEPPAQTEGFAGVIIGVRVPFTFTVALAVAVQPFEALTITV